MQYFSVRATNFYAAFACWGLLAAAYYFQLVMELEPCPLCMVQRAVILLLSFLFLFAARRKLRWGRTLHFFIFAFSSLGAASAGRQVWLQHLPPHQVPACGPDLHYMIGNLPLSETFKSLIHGSGSCAEVQWQFLGLSMPSWTLLVFVGFCSLALINGVRFRVAQQN